MESGIRYNRIHATPDFLSSCDCCGLGCGEIKYLYSMEGVDFIEYVKKPRSCLIEDENQCKRLDRKHQYFYQVQQQIFTTQLLFCDFVVVGFTASSFAFVHERILPDKNHWEIVLPKLLHFWRYCVLPEVTGRWYTRTSILPPKKKSSNDICFCTEDVAGSTVKCKNVDCPISTYHISCLKLTQVPASWLCQYCPKLPEFKRKSKQKEDPALSKALALETICVCKTKAKVDDNIIECHNESCKQGKFFHISCLGYKRRPYNSKTTWCCDYCKGNCKKKIKICTY